MKSNLFSRAKLQTVELENTLTPLEIADLLKHPKYRQLPFSVSRLLRTEPPKRYLRYPLAPTVIFYSANCGARDLLIGFAAAATG